MPVSSLWCGLPSDLRQTDEPDIIVFPEWTSLEDIEKTSSMRPGALVAGAYPVLFEGEEKPRMRGAIFQEGENRIDYWKAGNDTHSLPSPPPRAAQTYRFGEIVVCMAICMDIDRGDVMFPAIEKLREEPEPIKVLLVPAAMNTGAGWLFQEGIALLSHSEIYVALSNRQPKGPGGRVKSFIAYDRQIILPQKGDEAICQALDRRPHPPKA